MDRPLDRLAFYDKPEKCSPQTRERLKATIINRVKPSGKDTDIIKLCVFHVYTVCILNFEPYPQQFKDMYKNAIIDLDMKDDLERSNVINWCRTTKQLYPMKTTADGNCLLHAVSLGLWGIEDSDQFLRRLLYLNITTDGRGMFKKRWLAYQRQSLNSNRFNVRINTEAADIAHSEACQTYNMVSQVGYPAAANTLTDKNVTHQWFDIVDLCGGAAGGSYHVLSDTGDVRKSVSDHTSTDMSVGQETRSCIHVRV